MSQTKAIVDKLLTGASSMYAPKGFIAEMIFPEIKVMQKTGKLAKYGTNHLRIENTLMGGRGMARRVEAITRSTDTYSVESHGLEGVVTPDDKANVEKPYDAEKDETIGLTTLLQVSKEYALSSTLGNASIITQNTTLSGIAQYSDYANSDPLGDIVTAQGTILDGVGFNPNTAIMSQKVYNTLVYHPSIIENFGRKYVQGGRVSEEDLKAALGVERIFIGSAAYESAAEGQTSSLTQLWGKNIIFAYIPERAEPYQKSLGYEVLMAGEQPRKVYKFPVYNPPDSTGIIVKDSYDFFLTDVKAAYLIKNAIA